MSNTNNEPNQGGPDGDLQNLPDAERKETQEILDDIAKTNAGSGKPEDVKPDAKPPEPPKAPEATPDSKPDGNDKDKQPDVQKSGDRREVSLMPTWMHKADESKWNKEKEDLMGQIEKLSKSPGAPSKDGQGGEKPPQANGDYKAEVAKIAEQYQIQPELAEALVKVAIQNSGKIPADVEAKLAKIDKLESERAIEVETAKFSNDFDTIVLPLIKAEYGDDVPAEVVSKIKEDLKSVAYTPEYARVPYTTIYKGTDQFRGIIPPKKAGAERSRGGHHQSKENSGAGEMPSWKEKVEAGEKLTDEEVSKLSDDEFEAYSNTMAVRERKQ